MLNAEAEVGDIVVFHPKYTSMVIGWVVASWRREYKGYESSSMFTVRGATKDGRWIEYEYLVRDLTKIC